MKIARVGRSAARLLLLLPILLAACSSPWQGPPTGHFDGQRFFNPGPPKTSSVPGYLWLRLTTSQGEWPDAVPLAPMPPPAERRDDGSAGITWIGHATLLIQVAGLNILTDPVWSELASPLSWAGPRRVSPAAVPFDALPPIDLVLISHDHYDHLDIDTLRRLDARDKPRVVAPLGHLRLLQEAMPASRVSEHDWGERVDAHPRLAVHVEAMKHGSGRSPFDQMSRLWAAYVLQADGLKIHFVGDSGYGDGALFADTVRRHPDIDLSILPIGAYEPASFMADSHMSPAEAVALMKQLRARQALAHHFEAFPLGFEAYTEPRRALAAAMASAGVPAERFRALQPGQSLVIERQTTAVPRPP